MQQHPVDLPIRLDCGGGHCTCDDAHGRARRRGLARPVPRSVTLFMVSTLSLGGPLAAGVKAVSSTGRARMGKSGVIRPAASPAARTGKLAVVAASAGPGSVRFSSKRGGSPGPGLISFAASAGSVPAPAPAATAAPKAPSKARLPSLDSLRFFLIAYIAVGHFVAFATKSGFALKLLTQVNVWVGAFFVLSGYVAGYTATEQGKFEASARVAPAGAYTLARVMGFYPLYALVQLLFGAMFAFADNFYNGPVATAAHFLMSATLSQAWFPAHAEVWNAPTWFLSALTFAMVVLPYALPAIARMRAAGLKKLLAALTGFSLLAKLAYSYDLGVWTLMEGVARSHPNLLLWNVTRFHPFYALLEVLMGVAAVRLVMTEDLNDDGTKKATPPAPAGSALLPALGLVGITVARAAGWLTLNDPLTRGALFIPLFLVLLTRLHRNTLAGAKGLTALLAHPLLTYLGAISFPIFIVHGAPPAPRRALWPLAHLPPQARWASSSTRR